MTHKKVLQWRGEVKKEYRKRISRQQWDAHRVKIIERYSHSTLAETTAWIESECGFNVSVQQLRKQLTEKWNITKYQKSSTRVDPGANVKVQESASDFNETPIETTNGSEQKNTARKRKSQQITSDTLASKRLKDSQTEDRSLDSDTDRQISELDVPFSGTNNGALPNIPSSPDEARVTVRNQEDSQYQRSMGENTLLNSTSSSERSFSKSGQSGVLSPRSLDSATLWSGSKSKNLSDGSSCTAPKVRLDFFKQFKLPQKDLSRLNKAEVKVDHLDTITLEEIAALRIDVADSTKVYSDKESETIQNAADLLFACGLRVDAFPLYLLLWKQQKKGDLGADIFIQCLRCICTEEHCFIMKNLLNDQLNYMESAISQNVRANACLFHLVMARICSVEEEKGLIASYLQNASYDLKELDEIFYQFATTTVFAPPDSTKARQVLPAILEEVLMVTESRSLRKRATIAPVKSVLNIKATYGLALALNLRKTSRSTSHETKQSVRDFRDHLFNWLSIVLETETRSKKLLLAYGSIEADLALFSHIWLEWKVPFWMDNRAMQLRKKLEGTVTIELLAVLSSLLADHKKETNAFGTEYSFDTLLSTAKSRLSELRTMNEEVASNGRLLDLIQERYIWMLRRHALHHFDPPPALRKCLRAFVESTLNINLPDIPTHLSKQEANRHVPRSMFYRATTLSRSLHPSESSSYRVFAESGKKSIRSVCTPYSRSSYSSLMRPVSETLEFRGTLFSAFDTLSVSLQSMSITGEDSSAGILDGGEHFLEDLSEANEE